MAVTPQTLQAIKSASLSSIIEATGASLKRVGHEFSTQCLWHDDTNPSLTVNDDKGMCFCHVCRGGGDAIDYIQQRYGLTWRESAEKAAAMAGARFELDDENPEETARRAAARKRSVDALLVQQKTFKDALRDPRAERIRQILKDRGLTAKASSEFGIGYASSGPFSGRITLPIFNHRNELVGFTGRTVKNDPAKYKNSENNDIFDKKSLVFNEVRAKEAAREAGSIVFVEGHLDVVAMWQAGIRNVVALQGTGAPDPAIIKRLARNTKNFILCFDGDAGGKKAAEQFIGAAGPMALAGEISINVVTLPEKKDPDEIIREGGNLYNYLASAPSWLDWVIDTWAAALDKDDTAAITDVENKLRQLISGMRSKALRAHYIDKAARVLARSEKEAEKLAKEWGNDDFVSGNSAWQPRGYIESRLAAERRLVRIFVHRPGSRKELAPLLGKIQNPALLWLKNRLQELQELSSIDLTPHSVMAVVCVAEPHYMQQLRTLVRPNVIIDDEEGVVEHLRGILENEVPNLNETNELDTD
jgi:DNA primase